MLQEAWRSHKLCFFLDLLCLSQLGVANPGNAIPVQSRGSLEITTFPKKKPASAVVCAPQEREMDFPEPTSGWNQRGDGGNGWC